MNRQRVVWSDGTILEPQHFQQQERAIYGHIARLQGFWHEHLWGFCELAIDESALRQGVVIIERCVAQFPDGSLLESPGVDRAVAPLGVAEVAQNDTLCIAIKRDNAGQAIDLGGQSADARFDVMDVEVEDVNQFGRHDGPRVSAIQVAGLRARVLPERLITAGMVSIPFARVQGIDNGAISLDTSYACPVLMLSASTRLHDLVNTVKRVVSLRLDQITRRGGRWSTDVAALIEMQILNTLSGFKLEFDQLAARTICHPREMYQLLAGLAGRLACVPGNEAVSQREFIYKHEDLSRCFEDVTRVLIDALSLVLESQVIALPFEERKGIHVHKIDPHVKLEKMILSVRSSIPAESLIKHFPAQVKIAPVERIAQFIELQLPGARLEYIATPPRHVPHYPECAYFQVLGSDPVWAETRKSAAIAMSVVGKFPGLKIDAWGIRSGVEG